MPMSSHATALAQTVQNTALVTNSQFGMSLCHQRFAAVGGIVLPRRRSSSLTRKRSWRQLFASPRSDDQTPR